MLNPDLDREALAAKWREDGRLRIENVLQPEIAERIHSALKSSVPFRYIMNIEGKNETRTPEEMRDLKPEELRETQAKIFGAASKGVGFYYCGYMMGQREEDTQDEDLKFLNSVFEYVNSDELLSFIRDITDLDDLKSAAAQYTRYTPGQFLTRHRDEVGDEQRRLAFVFGFSKNWHPDWGGMLQFFEDDGTPRESWAPMFNSVSMFEIRHVHSVTFVTPFALEPRLSLTGWFRAKER